MKITEAVKWTPINKDKKVIPVSAGNKLTLSFEGMDRASEHLRERITAIITRLLNQGYDYLIESTNGELPLSKKFLIEFTPRKNHAHEGTLMKISIPMIIHTLENETDLDLEHREISRLAHELTHNITDGEDFPMFIEIIYLLETKQQERLEEIERLCKEDKFPKQYVIGLYRIAEWLNIDIGQLFEKLKSMTIEDLKLIFKKQILEYYEKEIKSLEK